MVFRTVKLFVIGVMAALLLDELLVRLFVPVRNVGPSFSEYDPIYGKSQKKSFSCTRITPEFRMSFSTNSLGQRGPDPVPSRERPILFVGDSFTEGYGVSDGEEFPALVREAMKARLGAEAPPVINAGVGNIGNGRWLKFLRREGQLYNPQLIVLQLAANDFDDNVMDRMFTLSDDGGLVEHDPPAPGMFRFVQSTIEAIPGLSYSYLVGLIREAYYFTRAVPDAPADEKQQQQINRLTFMIVEEIIRLCQQAQWPLLVMVVGFEPERRQEMESILKQHQLPYIIPPDKKDRPDLYYAIDGHWNAKGHEFIALQVLEALVALGFPKRELAVAP